MKIDLHCHSRFSHRPTLWIMQKLGCPESFTQPGELYHAARARGMSAVTITDHNTIAGALEIAELPNAFVSCEYTAYFPEDRCKVHVLVYDIDEAHHEQLIEARQDLFAFVQYLNAHQIAHACAHPLFGPNDRLQATHIEKLLLLFKVWEWNGDLAPEMNRGMRLLTEGLTEEKIGLLSERHEIEAVGQEPWRKCIIAGSDDHSSLNLASAYTEVRGALDFSNFWEGVYKMQAKTHAGVNTPQGLARDIYSIGYQFYRDKFQLDKYVRHDSFLLFMDRILQNRTTDADSRLTRLQRFLSGRRRTKQNTDAMTLMELARHEASQLIQGSPEFLDIAEHGVAQSVDPQVILATFINTLSNKMLAQLGENLAERLANARLFDLFHSLGSAAALYSVLAPYFVSYSHFVRQRRQARRLLETLDVCDYRPLPEAPKVAHFTDTFFEVNGVARTLQQQLATAISLGKGYCVVTCDTRSQSYIEGLQQFAPVGAWKLPEYPEIELFAPPFLQLLQYCYDEGFTHLHTSTPGPMGLAALGIARILQLPISGTYHTAMPQYGRILTEDSYVEELLWKGMIAFYEQLDTVYAPSKATASELVERGLSPDKIRIYPRGVDTDRFHPEKKDHDLLRHYVQDNAAEVTLLYVGRISKEKGLDVLAEAFCRLIDLGAPARLLVVGDGPYRDEMQTRLQAYPVFFTGYMEGETLPAIYASSDILVFPSATDTFGNVVLEAQAAGTPVIVTDQGGPVENMLPNQTGLVCTAGDSNSLTEAMFSLTKDSSRRKQFSVAARDYIEGRSFKTAFETLYAMYVSEDPPDCAPKLDIISAMHLGNVLASGVA